MPTPISGRVSKPSAKSSAAKTKTKTKPQTVSREERQERRRAIEAEDRREWENQYLQGKPSEYFAGYDREIEPNDSPYFDFVSPFEGPGRFESTTEKDEPGWDFLRVSSGLKTNPKYHLFVIPHQHIEQIITIPDKIKNKNMFHIVIVPTAATGSSAAVKKYPKIIRLQMSKSSVQQAHLLRDAQGQPSFKNHLQSPEKQEVLFHQNTRDQSQPIMFKCHATLDGENDSYIEKSEGSLYFLPNGILWLGTNTFYFPTGSINFAMLLFARDWATTKYKKSRKTPITAMGLMITASEPFYEGDESPRLPFLHFKDIQNYPFMREHIEKYCEAHKMGLKLTESTYYNYQEGSMMSGWMSLDETEEPLPEAEVSGSETEWTLGSESELQVEGAIGSDEQVMI